MKANHFLASVRQYMMPDGRVVETSTELPDYCRPEYLEMHEHGCRLEAEVLQTWEVSVTIFNPASEEDVDIEVVSNGPGVQSAYATMLKRRLFSLPTSQ